MAARAQTTKHKTAQLDKGIERNVQQRLRAQTWGAAAAAQHTVANFVAGTPHTMQAIAAANRHDNATMTFNGALAPLSYQQ